jgi:lysophospholipase L1-like esterase
MAGVYHGELDGYTAEKVIVLIGTNNLGINTDAEIIEGLRQLLAAIKLRQPKAEILLSGLLPRRKMEERITTLNMQMALLAKESRVSYADPGQVLLKKDKTIDDSLFSDGLHPNEEGYRKLGKALAGYLD